MFQSCISFLALAAISINSITSHQSTLSVQCSQMYFEPILFKLKHPLVTSLVVLVIYIKTQ